MTSRKGWTPETLQRLGVERVGDGRFVFHVETDDGLAAGTLRYDDAEPDPKKKIRADVGSTRQLWPRPEIVDGATLYVVEGEPDAVSMAELGLPAVGYPGVGKRSADWPHRLVFGPNGRRERVVVLSDCDAPGRKRAREFASEIADVGLPAFVVDFDPERDDGWDVGDLLRDALGWDAENGREVARRIIDERAAKAERIVPAEPPQAPAPKNRPSERRVVLTPANDIQSERGRWLWRDRIPLRGLTVVAGEKGLGKSILTNAQLVAAVTRGKLDGELSEPVDVLVLTAEDDWRTVVKPRLMAHGADLSRVHRVEVHDRDGISLLTLPDDVAIVEAEIVRLRAAGRTVAMFVVDPIGAFVSETTNTHADAPVRRALAPLAALADRQDLAIPVVAHLTKDDAKRVIARVSGAGAFVNAARSVLAVVRDPEDPDGEQGMRLILHVASNWGVYAPTLAVHVEGRDVKTDDGAHASVGYLVVDGESSATVDDLQRGHDEDHADVEEAIGSALANGARPSNEVKGLVTAELGCSRSTVDRAARRVSARGELTIESGGFPRRTTWTLAVASGAAPIVASNAEPSRDVTGENDATAPDRALSQHSRVSRVTLRH